MSINPHKYRPYDFDQLLGILSEKRQNNYLYIQVRVPDGGMVIKGSELTDLPPSVLSVMDSKRSTGLTRKLRDQVLAEYKIPTEYMILGAKRLFVRLNQPQQATLPEPDGKEENNAYIMDEHDFWKNVD
jgi:hypothetical protein